MLLNFKIFAQVDCIVDGRSASKRTAFLFGAILLLFQRAHNLLAYELVCLLLRDL